MMDIAMTITQIGLTAVGIALVIAIGCKINKIDYTPDRWTVQNK
ncbi:MAG: hypothetical protein RJQ09_21630 [Cyclobacteriaceae bacterium]